jgi:hypothetical protein
MITPRLLVSACIVVCLSARSTTTSQRTSNRGADAVAQPMRDLALFRKETPPVLTAAAAAPYVATTRTNCAGLIAEISALNDALGPDLDVPPEKRPGFAEDTAIAALGSLFKLPFRSVIRKVSGAERMDREKALAVLSGMVRRGYLKGLATAAGCTIPAFTVESAG